MATVLTEQGEMTVAATNGLWLSADDAERATGWTLKPEGMCQDDVCVPLPVRDGRVDVAAFWRLLGRPVVQRRGRRDVGARRRRGAAQQRARRADGAGLHAARPRGMPHTLSALRGKKVFLCTWASW